jgi:hypothetical protein
MKKMKKTLYTLVGAELLTMNSANIFLVSNADTSTNDWWRWEGSTSKACSKLDPTCTTGSEMGLFTVVQNIIGWLTGFLYIVAVIYWLWWGFQILTASGEEEKVKKWKKVLINAWIWLVIIFLVGSIVRFVIDALIKWSTTT